MIKTGRLSSLRRGLGRGTGASHITTLKRLVLRMTMTIAPPTRVISVASRLNSCRRWRHGRRLSITGDGSVDKMLTTSWRLHPRANRRFSFQSSFRRHDAATIVPVISTTEEPGRSRFKADMLADGRFLNHGVKLVVTTLESRTVAQSFRCTISWRALSPGFDATSAMEARARHESSLTLGFREC